ncbi:MAG: hypothetical protein AB1733_11735 [Thermodesulfobacteriota bacterium]
MEREHILQYIRTILKERLGASVTVTRNIRRAASVKELPVVFIIDNGDEVLEPDSGPISKRVMRIDIESVFQGSTEEKTPEELADFQLRIRRALFGEECRRIVGTTYTGSIYETRISEIELPHRLGPKTAVQRIGFEVAYLEDIRRLFE